MRARPLSPRAALAVAALGGAAAAGVGLQRRHLRAIAGDEDYRHLSAPLGGQPQTVRSADGTELHVEVFGSGGDPTVVLAHGWTECLALWGPVLTRLVDGGVRVVAYDLRGHGNSQEAADGDYSLERFGDDLEAVLAACAGEAPAIVAGHSMGAMSIAAWAEHRDARARARGAALINTGLGDLLAGHLLVPGVLSFLNQPWASRAFLGSRAPMLPFSTPLQQAMIRYTAFGPHAAMGEVAFYERMLMECPPHVRAACGVALAKMDLWHALERVNVPTLVVAGDSDRLTPPSHAQRIAKELPECAGLIELEATGHMSPLERPREIADALAQLVRDTAAVPAAAAGGGAVGRGG